MKKISAEIVADSVNEHGNRITTFLLTFPRFILAELNTHRMFSRNSASSRAIPFEKMVKMVEKYPFIPIAWQKDHRGMQGSEYLTDELSNQFATSNWLSARDNAIKIAKSMNGSDNGYDGITKQLCNRLLEPFMWHTTLISATEFDNFFELRCPKYHTPVSGEGFYFKSKKDCIANHSNPENLEKLKNMSFEEWESINTSQAEIHIQALAESMWDAMNESIPKKLQAGEWHIPFGDKIDLFKLAKSSDVPQDFYKSECEYDEDSDSFYQSYLVPQMIKIATARCARLSYMTFDGEIDYEKDIKLHDRLLAGGHMSPFEHCARVMSNEEYRTFIRGKCEVNPISEEVISPVLNEGWCNNFKGFIQYRYLIENKI